jgi:hypothetical protein
MALLAHATYDPAAAVTKNTTALLAMTALDTTNLRVTFTVPANGSVLVRLKGLIHGSTGVPDVLLGILDGSTLRGRMSPFGFRLQALVTERNTGEAVYTITGLTPGSSQTWDAAYGCEALQAGSGIKYGGPDNATTDDAFGAFSFEVWEATNLIKGTLYDPTTSASFVTTSLLAMTALDTTNLRHTFTVPASGRILWRIATQHQGSATFGSHLLGILDGSTVKARMTPVMNCLANPNATHVVNMEASGIISGLTPGASLTYDAAYGVEVISGAGGAIKHGGPNNTTANDAFGGTAFEIWKA